MIQERRAIAGKGGEEMESRKERVKPVMLQERVSEQKAGEHPQKPCEVASRKARLPGGAGSTAPLRRGNSPPWGLFGKLG